MKPFTKMILITSKILYILYLIQLVHSLSELKTSSEISDRPNRRTKWPNELSTSIVPELVEHRNRTRVSNDIRDEVTKMTRHRRHTRGKLYKYIYSFFYTKSI